MPCRLIYDQSHAARQDGLQGIKASPQGDKDASVRDHFD